MVLFHSKRFYPDPRELALAGIVTSFDTIAGQVLYAGEGVILWGINQDQHFSDSLSCNVMTEDWLEVSYSHWHTSSLLCGMGGGGVSLHHNNKLLTFILFFLFPSLSLSFSLFPSHIRLASLCYLITSGGSSVLLF